MAKKRVQVGSLYKSKDSTKPNYIKVNRNMTLTEGQFISAESKKFQLESLERAVAEGKLDGEKAEKARSRIEKIPDYVIAELIVLEDVQ